jgi:hypothetical protein
VGAESGARKGEQSMSETQQAVADPNYNPFDPANHAQGGGLWDGKTVTITGSRTATEALKYGDGKPVTNDKGEQSIQTALIVSGIAEGGDDKERKETYSGGEKLAATPDGEGFVAKDGGPLKFHANSNMAKFAAALKASGFDLSTLVVDGKQRLSKLVGARFVFKGEAKIGRDGKSIKDKKGYDKSIFLPVKFLGYAGGAPATKGGNGAVGGNGSALDAKAASAILAALAANGGKLNRASLVRELANVQLKGDTDANAIISLVVQDGYHKGKAWKYDPIEGASL